MEQLPSKVFKYFNWDDVEAKKILTEREMYFCNAKKWKNYGEYDFQFNAVDKYETYNATEAAVYKMRKEDFKLYERWFNIHIIKFQIDVGVPDKLSVIERDLWEVQMVDKIIQHRVLDMINNKNVYEASTKNFYYRHTGIFSTSLTSQSKQLWEWKKNYKNSNNGNAVCVGLDLLKIKDKLDTIGNYSIGMIKYQDGQNEVDFTGTGNAFLVARLNSISFTLRKDVVKDILDQEELRIMKFLTGDLAKKSAGRFMSLNNDFITEIFIHSAATDKTKEEVEGVAKYIDCKSISFV